MVKKVNKLKLLITSFTLLVELVAFGGSYKHMVPVFAEAFAQEPPSSAAQEDGSTKSVSQASIEAVDVGTVSPVSEVPGAATAGEEGNMESALQGSVESGDSSTATDKKETTALSTMSSGIGETGAMGITVSHPQVNNSTGAVMTNIPNQWCYFFTG